MKQAVRKKAKGGKRKVRVLLATLGSWASVFPPPSLPLTIPRGYDGHSLLCSLRFFFPLLRNAKKNLSASSRRVSNSGQRFVKERALRLYRNHRSISTAPYLTASVTSVTSKPASPFLPIKPTP